MTRVGVITQARMTSTRLPGKVLLEADGKSMLRHQIERLQDANLDVYIATTVNSTDDPIIEEAEHLGIPVFRGDEHDVLHRFAQAAKHFKLDAVVRVTSDCPLIDGELVREGIHKFIELDDPRAYVSNTQQRTYPRGFDFSIFSTQALHFADTHATAQAEREHVTPFFYAGTPPWAHLHSITNDHDNSRYRLTLDTAEDFQVIQTLIETHAAHTMSASEIVAVMKSHPALSRMNATIHQKDI